MKRILLDHNAPRPLVRLLTAFNVKTAAECGWDKLRNGKLLAAAEENGFDVLLTGDKTIPDENVISGLRIGVCTMSDNHWPVVRNHVPAIAEALHKCKPGQVVDIFCGEFNRRKSAKPEP